jgi:hypothetical protein
MQKVYCSTLQIFVEVNSDEWYDLVNGITSFITVKIGNETYSFNLKDFN